MNKEELYWKFKRIDDRFRKAEENGKAFRNEMSQVLCDLVIKYNENIKNRQEDLKEPLLNLTKVATQEVFDCLDYAVSAQQYNEVSETTLSIPKPETKQEAALKLEEELNKMPDECREDYPDYYWKWYEEKRQENLYKEEVFNTMKKVLVKYYQGHLLELDGIHLRKLDVHMYYNCACDFISEVYKL